MERLTFEGNFCDISQCEAAPGGSFCEDGTCDAKKVWERLKEYEDTGLTPEEINDLASVREISPEAEYAINKHADSIIERLDKLLVRTNDDDRLRELARADREGRVVVLPCKVGDTVYIPDIESKNVADVRVQGISITRKNHVVLHFGGYPAKSEWGDRCGIDWFLTKEEAEKALEARHGNQ